MTGEPNLRRQEAKWSPAGVAKGVALSTKKGDKFSVLVNIKYKN